MIPAAAAGRKDQPQLQASIDPYIPDSLCRVPGRRALFLAPRMHSTSPRQIQLHREYVARFSRLRIYKLLHLIRQKRLQTRMDAFASTEVHGYIFQTFIDLLP
jgi:hypothetical protein